MSTFNRQPSKLRQGCRKAAVARAQSSCKHCGQTLNWPRMKGDIFAEVPSHLNKPTNNDGTYHDCRPKVKVFTKEEIALYQKGAL